MTTILPAKSKKVDRHLHQIEYLFQAIKHHLHHLLDLHAVKNCYMDTSHIVYRVSKYTLIETTIMIVSNIPWRSLSNIRHCLRPSFSPATSFSTAR